MIGFLLTIPVQLLLCEWITCPFITQCGLQTEHYLERFVCCKICISVAVGMHVHWTVVQQLSILRCHQNACLPQQLCISKPLPLNGHPLWLHHSSFQTFWHTCCHGNVLNEGLPSNRLCRLSGIMSQYICSVVDSLQFHTFTYPSAVAIFPVKC
jgi:hypothetical protein